MDSQILVQTDRIEKKISALYPGYGGYVSGSIVVLMNLASCIQGYFSTTYILVYLRISHHIEGWAACIGGGGGSGVAWREGQRLVATATKTLQLLQHNFRRGVGQRV